MTSRFESVGYLVTKVLICRDREDWAGYNAAQQALERDHGFRLAFTDTHEPKERDALGGDWGYTAPTPEEDKT